MFLKTEAIPIVTAPDGTATIYSSNLTGRVLEVRVVVPGSGGLAATTDITITNETTGTAILTATDRNGSATYCPRQATHSVAGAAALYAASGTAVNDYCYLAGQRLKIVVAQGGDTLAGTLYVTVG
jgi:hypothetical protein